MWCDTVGCERPTGAVRSQMQASPSSLAAINDSRRTRLASARALNVFAMRSASAWSTTAAVSGAQHVSASFARSGRVIVMQTF